MTDLEKKILQDFYNQNNNPKIEVILDYERVYGSFIDKKTFLFEGEHITDGFIDMKTTICFDEKKLDKNQIRAFHIIQDVEIDKSKIFYFLENDFQKIIDRNSENGCDVKIIVGAFHFGIGMYYKLHTDVMTRNLLTTYKVERI